jgi:hypothetical protein
MTAIPDGVVRERLGQLVLDGENLPGFAAGPQPDTAWALRKRYLRWHDELLRVLHAHFPDEPIAERFETTSWQLVLGDRVSDDELTRTILGDVEIELGYLRGLIESVSTTPARALPDPATVGVAVYDANCLFAKHIRRLLLGFAVYGIVRARWSRKLLKETAGNLAGRLRGDSLEDLGRWLRDEIDLVRDGLVEGYERWSDQIELPDPGDVHVVAAAIESGATTIVTSNLRHFPAKALDPFGITAVSPDDFALRCIDANPVLAVRIVTDQDDPERFVDRIAQELPRTAQALREFGF